MKIYEIVSEQKLNELTMPNLGVIPGVTKAADYVSKAYKGYQRGKDLKAAQAARKARQAKDIFGRYKYSLKGLQGQERLDMIAKRAALSANAASVAKNAVNSANSNLALLIKILGAGAVFTNYFMKMSAIEEDFVELRDSEKSGKELSENNIFGGMNIEQARDQGQLLRQDLLGEAVLQLMGLGLGGKLIAVPGQILKHFGLLGQFLALPANAFAWLVGLGGQGAKMTALKAALTAWFSTDSGQEFLKQTATGLLVIATGQFLKSVFGPVASWTADILVGFADEAAKFVKDQLGIDVSPAVDHFKSPFSQTAPDKATQDALAQRQANIKYVKGIQVTGPDGYLPSTRDFWLNPKLKNIVDIELGNNRPHPLAGLPLNPKAQYPTDLMAKLSFTPS